MQSPYGSITILGITQETDDVKTFNIANTDSSSIVYEAGQFITLISDRSGSEERRSYSFSSSPDAATASITVKRIDNGVFSRYLFDTIKPGDTVSALKPSGFFTLPADVDTYDQIVFFAAGVGITPIISLVKTVLSRHRSVSITLVYSNRSITDTVFFDELEELQEQNADRFYIEYLFSSSADLMHASEYQPSF